jgi:CRP-like cAMP-binding protein
MRSFSPTRLLRPAGPPRGLRGTASFPPSAIPERLPSLTDPACRLAVEARLQPLTLDDEETLFSQGDRGSSVFFICSGTVTILVGGREVARLGAGKYFGELGLMLNDSRAATIVAAEQCDILELTRDDFYAARREREGGAGRGRERWGGRGEKGGRE